MGREKVPAPDAELTTGSGTQAIDLRGMAAALRRRDLDRPILYLIIEALSGLASIASLEQGIVLLEAANVRALAVSISWSRRLPRLAADEYWSRAFLVSSIARHWAYRLRRVDPEQAFVAGLLQQIGKLRLRLHPSPGKDYVGEGLRVARRLGFAPWAVEVIGCTGAHLFTGPYRELAVLVDLARRCAAWLSISATDASDIPVWIFSRYEDTDVVLPEPGNLREPREEGIRIWARFPLRAEKGADRQ